MKILLFAFFSFLFIFSYAQKKNQDERIADSLADIGKIKEAIPLYLNALKTRPKDEQLLRSTGYCYLSLNQIDEGEKYYDKALAVNPKCARCYMNLARIYNAQNYPKKAVDFMDKAAALDDQDASIFAVKGALEEYLGASMKALLDYNRAVQLEPTNAEYYFLRARFNQRSGYTSLSLGDIKKGIELAPGSYFGHHLYGNYYTSLQQNEAALDELNKAVLLDSNRSDLFIDRGMIYSKLGEHDKAIADCDHSIRLNPEDYRPYYNRSLEKQAMENIDGACNDRSMAANLMRKHDPENSHLQTIVNEMSRFCDSAQACYYYQRGLAFFLMGKPADALPFYEKGLQRFPRSIFTVYCRADSRSFLHDHANAITDYETVLKSGSMLEEEFLNDPKFSQSTQEERRSAVNLYMASSCFSLAGIYGEAGKLATALDYTNRGLDSVPEMPKLYLSQLYNFRGEIEFQLHKFEEAAKDFERAIEIDSSFARTYVNRALSRINEKDLIRAQASTKRSNEVNALLSTNWSLSLTSKVKKSNQVWLAALDQCNKAIALDPNLGYAFYVRGFIKLSLGFADYCVDFKKAKELGETVEDYHLTKCK